MGRRACMCLLIALAVMAAARHVGGQDGFFGVPESLLRPEGNFAVRGQAIPAKQAPGGQVLVRFTFAAADAHYVWRDGVAVELLAGGRVECPELHQLDEVRE